MAADPHSVSLKVLRLSRPTLATQNALPDSTFPNGLSIEANSSYAYSQGSSSFSITPLLTLPATFGLAYVGETFACTLCINNEVNTESATTIAGIQISATMQTPGDQTGKALTVQRADESKPTTDQLQSGDTMQLILKHDLKESGPHVLAVMITYSETKQDGEEPATRTRTFRKLYQFVAQQLIAVRSKVSTMKARGDGTGWWVIEAQLENVGESSVTLEKVAIEAREGFEGIVLDAEPARHVPITLKPQDVEQVMFFVKATDPTQGTTGKRQLAQLSVLWRGALGEPGRLSTGWLESKT